MAAFHQTLSTKGLGRSHGCCVPVADGLGLTATAIIRLASQDQQKPWLVSPASLLTP